MNNELRTLYRQFREHSPFMLVGQNAKLAIDSARVLMRWQELESDGLVSITSEFDNDPDPGFYDTWEHLSERSKRELKDRYCDDCWGVIVSTIDPATGDESQVASIWGCSGYDDVCSPFENCYVIDMMREAVEACENITYQI